MLLSNRKRYIGFLLAFFLLFPALACNESSSGTDENTTNNAPVADAGSTQSIQVNTLAILDGSASSDTDGDTLTYLWSFLSIPTGSSATLSDPNTSEPSFTPDLTGVYIINLVVNDGTVNSSADRVTITATEYVSGSDPEAIELQATYDRSQDALDDIGLNIPISDIAELADIDEAYYFWPTTDDLLEDGELNLVEVTSGAIADLESVIEAINSRPALSRSRSEVSASTLERAIIHLKLAHLYTINAVARIVNSPLSDYITLSSIGYYFNPPPDANPGETGLFTILDYNNGVPNPGEMDGYSAFNTHIEYVQSVVESSQVMMDALYLLIGYYSQVELQGKSTEYYLDTNSVTTDQIDFDAQIQALVDAGVFDETYLDATNNFYQNQTRISNAKNAEGDPYFPHNTLYHFSELVDLVIELFVAEGENPEDNDIVHAVLTIEETTAMFLIDSINSTTSDDWGVAVYTTKQEAIANGFDTTLTYTDEIIFGNYFD